MDNDALTDDEMAAIAAVLMIASGDDALQVTRVREVWPSPSPWRWAPIPG